MHIMKIKSYSEYVAVSMVSEGPKVLSLIRKFGKKAISKGSQPLVLRTNLAHQNCMTPVFFKKGKKITKCIAIIRIGYLLEDKTLYHRELWT